MTCVICFKLITSGQPVNQHHEIYKCRGGKATTPVHKACHVGLHSNRGDFKAWGRIGGQITAQTKRWALNLLNVRSHPAHDINRQFYLAHYAH